MHRSVLEGAGVSRSQQPSRELKVFMNVLIVKLGATGDVVRTTPLLDRLSGQITWLTAAKNAVLLENLTDNLRCVSWEKRETALDANRSEEHTSELQSRFDLVCRLL